MDSGKRKLLMGCGIAALVMFVLLVATILASLFLADQMAAEFSDQIETSGPLARLDGEIPFIAPEDYSIDSNRFEVYLIVRANLLKAIDEHDIFEDAKLVYPTVEPNKKPTAAMVTTIMSNRLKNEKVFAGILREASMPPSEYFYHLGLTLITIKQLEVMQNQRHGGLWAETKKELGKVEIALGVIPEKRGAVEGNVEQMTEILAESVPAATSKIVYTGISDGRVTAANLAPELMFHDASENNWMLLTCFPHVFTRLKDLQRPR